MRYREPFTMYLRKLPSGKKVWYYQTYDEKNRRTNGFSTGKTSKTAARAYCYDLFKNDKLIPEKKLKLIFKEFAVDWWDWDKCEYLKYAKKRRKITRRYVHSAQRILDNHILPYFGAMDLREIEAYAIEKWLDVLFEKGLSQSSVTLYLVILKIMFKEAMRRKIIKNNPAADVAPLKKEIVKRGVLNHEEVKSLFDIKKKDEIWYDDISYYANLLAACTGMRMGEVLAVRGECLYEDYILVDKQYKLNDGLSATKTNYVREVVIPEDLMDELKAMSEANSGGFVFSKNSGKEPVGQSKIRSALNSALGEIEIDEQQRSERKLCFHSWRHYLNTMMRSNNISDGKLRAMVGHSSAAMTEHYTHFKSDDFKDIKDVQNKIIKFTKVG